MGPHPARFLPIQASAAAPAGRRADPLSLELHPRPGGRRKRLFESTPLLRIDARVRRQVDGIERLLGLKFRSRILDLGCGAGSQTLELARRRYRIVGMDDSAESLAPARARGRIERLTVHFVVGDMRRIPYEAEFSAVINLRNVVGGHPSEREDLRCLQEVRKSLRPGGKLLLDFLNREWLVRRQWAHRRAFELRTGRLDVGGFVSRGRRHIYKKGESIRVYSLTELIRLLGEAGLAFQNVWGGYDGRSYGVDSERLILLAEKGAEPRDPRVRRDDGFPRALRIKGRPH
ncbi:MAG: class I SAM-dependent methyltransferase [Elusimicrobiota bacterium]